MNVLYILQGPKLWHHFVIVCWARIKSDGYEHTDLGSCHALSVQDWARKAVLACWTCYPRHYSPVKRWSGYLDYRELTQGILCWTASGWEKKRSNHLTALLHHREASMMQVNWFGGSILAHIDSCKAVMYLSSTPRGWGNWYLSWGPSNIWNSARRTKEQWLPEPAMGRSKSEQRANWRVEPSRY